MDVILYTPPTPEDDEADEVVPLEPRARHRCRLCFEESKNANSKLNQLYKPDLAREEGWESPGDRQFRNMIKNRAGSLWHKELVEEAALRSKQTISTGLDNQHRIDYEKLTMAKQSTAKMYDGDGRNVRSTPIQIDRAEFGLKIPKENILPPGLMTIVYYIRIPRGNYIRLK
jgi:hypothetical protein